MNKILKNKLTVQLVSLLAFMLFIGTSCSDENEASVSSYNWEIEGNQIVNINPERYKLQRNPMQGWVIYSGIGDGMMDNFWSLYDNFDSSEGKIKVSDYGNTLYIRGAWSDFNPEEGVYIWQDGVNTKPAQRFRMQRRLRCYQGNLYIITTFLLQQANSPQSTPHTGKTGSNHKNARRHIFSCYQYWVRFIATGAARNGSSGRSGAQ